MRRGCPAAGVVVAAPTTAVAGATTTTIVGFRRSRRPGVRPASSPNPSGAPARYPVARRGPAGPADQVAGQLRLHGLLAHRLLYMTMNDT